MILHFQIYLPSFSIAVFSGSFMDTNILEMTSSKILFRNIGIHNRKDEYLHVSSNTIFKRIVLFYNCQSLGLDKVNFPRKK